MRLSLNRQQPITRGNKLFVSRLFLLIGSGLHSRSCKFWALSFKHFYEFVLLFFGLFSPNQAGYI